MELSPAPGVDPSAPEWFRRAVAVPTTSHWAECLGANIHYRCWNAGDTQKPPLLFVHGYRGHSRWWDFIAPFFIDRFRVYALDLSGMGDSDHRAEYSIEIHSTEIGAVIEQAGIAPAVVIGHSYGGSRTLRLCADAPGCVGRAIVLDSFVHFADTDPPMVLPKVGRATPFASFDAALARFRLLPAQASEPYLLHYIAHHSIKAVAGGWAWKFDTELSSGAPEPDGAAVLARIAIPVDCVTGALSVVTRAARAQRIVQRLALGRGPVVVPEAGHHLMLDQPLAMVAAIRALLA